MMKPYDVARQIRDSLAEIVDLYDEVLEPQRATSGIKLPTIAVEGEKMRYAGRAMRHSPPPISAAILDARRGCHEDLLHYARVVLMACVDINGAAIVTRVDHESIPDLCDFLDTWAFPLASIDPQEAAGCLRDMGRHARTLRVTAYPERRDWITIGDCPCDIVTTEGERVTCGAKLRAYGDKMNLADLEDRDARVRFIVCPVCGHEDTLDWWLARILPEGADVAPAESVIAFVSLRTAQALTHAQLRQWATRGFVRRHGRDERGRTLYRASAVLAWAKDQVQEEAA
jgi:hypothetical protein